VGFLDEEFDTVRPEGYFCHHVLWVTRGEGIFNVNGETFYISEGKGLFLRSGVAHSYRSSGGCFGTKWVTFFGGETLFDYYGVGDYMVFDVPEFLDHGSDELDRICTQNSDIFTRSTAGYTFFSDLMRICFEKSTSLTRRVDRFLEMNYSRDISLDEMAFSLGMGKYTLCHRFKEERGKTVIEQLTEMRVAKAKTLLGVSAFSVAEIGHLCGFNSPSYFIKIFKEQTGKTPLEFRTRRK
jgi:AraC-like DNA-binding protein